MRERCRIFDGMRGLAAAPAVAAALAASACGAAQTVVPPARPATGLLVGSVHIGGGPAGVSVGKVGGVVVVYSLVGRVVERQRVARGDDFRLVLRPGRYRLGFGKRNPDELSGCRPKIATVRPGRTTHQKLWFGCDWM
jgi:hypothetical protein